MIKKKIVFAVLHTNIPILYNIMSILSLLNRIFFTEFSDSYLFSRKFKKQVKFVQLVSEVKNFCVVFGQSCRFYFKCVKNVLHTVNSLPRNRQQRLINFLSIHFYGLQKKRCKPSYGKFKLSNMFIYFFYFWL